MFLWVHDGQVVVGVVSRVSVDVVDNVAWGDGAAVVVFPDDAMDESSTSSNVGLKVSSVAFDLPSFQNAAALL